MFHNFYQNQNDSENSKSYFCHQCQNQFNKSIPEEETPQSIECTICKSEFCEEVDETNETLQRPSPPSQTLPFIMRNPISIRRVLSNGQMIIEIRNVAYNRNINFPPQAISLSNIFLDHQFNQIVNDLMLNDSNKYGSPPASKESVERLENLELKNKDIEKIEDNECAICKEIFLEAEGIKKMPCKHFFHQGCLLTWLKEHNSCPICRFELKTDDEDYEQKKKGNN